MIDTVYLENLIITDTVEAQGSRLIREGCNGVRIVLAIVEDYLLILGWYPSDKFKFVLNGNKHEQRNTSISHALTLSCSIVVWRSNLRSERVSGEITNTLTVLDICGAPLAEQIYLSSSRLCGV